MNDRRWKRHATKTVLRDRWMHLTADRCELPSGVILDPFYVLHEPEWVQIVACNDAREILVVRQYRYAADALCTELPGGGVEAGEAPLEAARRELREETGFDARDWHAVGWMHANPARQTNRVHVFFATGLASAGAPQPDAAEDIAFEFIAPSVLEAAIEAGAFSQALHIAGYYRCRDRITGLEK